jgi:hypothetical protein
MPDVPGTINFPSSLDTTVSLIQAQNNSVTTLDGNISSSQSTITVASTSLFPGSGALAIEGEVIFYSGTTSTTFTECLRGQDGTTAAAHGSGSSVQGRIVAAHHNTLAQAIIAVEEPLLAATENPVSSTLVQRDGDGRAQVTDPSASSDIATKGYVDALQIGLSPKAAVRVATTASITLSGTQTIDGVALNAGDRVLVKDQSAGANNGLYDVAAGAWSRSTDADTNGEVTQGLYTFVGEGAVNGGKSFLLTTPNPITLGTTVLDFAQFGAGGGTSAHGALTGLGADDHPQYALLAGRNGGQVLRGSISAGEDLTLQSTGNATKGKILFGTAAVIDEGNASAGIGTTTPNGAAALEVSSTTKGFLPPRLTTAQRDAISAPPDGLVVFNTDDHQLQVAHGGTWAGAGMQPNYFGDGSDGTVVYSANTTLATSTGVDDTGLVIRNYASLTIDTGITVTAANRAQAMLLYVSGDCTINGHLHMDKKGAVGTPEDDLVLVRHLESSLFPAETGMRAFTIPAVGAAGGLGATSGTVSNGGNGMNGTSGQTGGGGGGAGGAGGGSAVGAGGSGSAGSAFCGGSGGGAGGYSGGAGIPGGSGGSNGGAGGNAGSYSSVNGAAAAGGAGNPVGTGNAGSGASVVAPTGGGGGTLILIVGGDLTIGSTALVSADGGDGGSAIGSSDRALGGGGAGGGSIIVLYAGTLSNSGVIRAQGGAAGSATGSGLTNNPGGAGGNGSVQGPGRITPA